MNPPRSSPGTRPAPEVDRATFGEYELPEAQTPRGWRRPDPPFRGRLSADGSTGWRAEPGRYHLYMAMSCGWAQRCAIVLRLVGLDDVVSASYVDDDRDARGWAFRERRGTDPVNGFRFLRDAYRATFPGYQGHVSTPVLWDRHTSAIVTNDWNTLPVDLATEFLAYSTTGVRLRPPDLVRRIDAVNTYLYENVNDGVYRADGAVSQQQYDHWSDRVVRGLRAVDRRLATRSYLFGDRLTESDIRLWVTLARFDLAYNPAGGITRTTTSDYPNIKRYACELYELPAFRDTTDFDSFRLRGTSPRRDGIARRSVAAVEPDWVAEGAATGICRN